MTTTALVTIDRPIPAVFARPYLKLVFAYAAARDIDLGENSPGMIALMDAAWTELVPPQPGGDRATRARRLEATTPRFYDHTGVLSPLDLYRNYTGGKR